MSGITREAWLTAVREIEAAPLPPSDALTIKEFALLLGLRRLAAQTRINALLASGKAERTKKAIRRSDNVIVSVTAYRLILEAPPDVRHANDRPANARRRRSQRRTPRS